MDFSDFQTLVLDSPTHFTSHPRGFFSSRRTVEAELKTPLGFELKGHRYFMILYHLIVVEIFMSEELDSPTFKSLEISFKP